MFDPRFLILLLFQSILLSARVDLKVDLKDKCGSEGSWLCFATGKCDSTNNILTIDRTIVQMANCVEDGRSITRIRKVEGNKYIVILEYSKNTKDLQEMTLSIMDGSSLSDRFGCRVNGDQLEPTVAPDVMELVPSLSKIESTGVYKCTGYIKEPITAKKTNQFKLKITLAGESPTLYDGLIFKPDIDVDKHKGCDQLLVNANWREGYNEDYQDQSKVLVALDDSSVIDKCDSETHGLFFKKFLDLPPQPVSSFSCPKSSDFYSVQIEGQEPINPKDPFLLFCAQNLNTNCKQPKPITDCTNCSEVAFTQGRGIVPSSLKCESRSYVVREGTKLYRRRLSGDPPVCTPRGREGVWSIQSSLEGESIEFTDIGCDEESSCYGKKPLHSECEDNDRNCTQASIHYNGTVCPFGMLLGYHVEGNQPQLLQTSKLSCTPGSRDWKPEISTSNVQCYFNSKRDKAPTEHKLSWKSMRIYILGPILLCLILISALLYVFIFRNRRRSVLKYPIVRQCAVTESPFIEYENESDEEDVPSTIRMGVDPEQSKKDGFTVRKEAYPDVPEIYYTRRDEKAETMHKNLGIVGPGYIDEGFADNFQKYSYWERRKFTEGIMNGVGTDTFIETFIELFMSMLQKEEVAAVWENMISTIRIISFTLSRRKYVGEAERIKCLLRRFGDIFMFKYKLIAKESETENESEMRALALYALLWSGCNLTGSRLLSLYKSKEGTNASSLRRITWTAVVRNQGKFDEVMHIFSEEVITPTPDDDVRFGTKRDHLIYALCASKDRSKSELFLNMLIKEDQFTARDVVVGFTAMVRDFDDCHEAAKSLFTERHGLIKTKIPVTTKEYKEILTILYTFATITHSSDDWLVVFTSAEDTYTEAERKELEVHLKKAEDWVEKYDEIPMSCFDENLDLDLNQILAPLEDTY